MKRVLLIGGLAAVLAAGCSPTRRCEKPQPYQSAETAPVPEAVDGITVPESPSALRIPPPAKNPVAYGTQRKDAKDPDKLVYECLDTPPRLRLQTAPAAEPAKPAADAAKPAAEAKRAGK